MSDSHRGGHPSSDTIAGYLDGALPPSERDAAEVHLATCAVCRKDLTEAAAVLDAVAPRRSWLIPVAAAAALALVLVPLVGLPRSGGDQHRRARTAGDETIPVAVAPLGRVAAPDTFVWRPVPGSDDYRIRVFDGAGNVRWQARTVDTTMALPDSIILAPGETHFWMVEARVGFERWVTSGTHEFTVERSRP